MSQIKIIEAIAEGIFNNLELKDEAIAREIVLKLSEHGFKIIPSKPKIICMCGSTRFADLMAAISWEFEKMGNIVLRVNFVPEWYVQKSGWKENSHGAEQEGLKEVLDELHCRKIDLCDIVYVCNNKGYSGESTTNEINYAKKIGKPIMYMELSNKNEMSEIASKLSRWWEDAK